MSEFECSVKKGKEMCRVNGGIGIQLNVNIYPIPKDIDLSGLAEVISDAIYAYEVEEE